MPILIPKSAVKPSGKPLLRWAGSKRLAADALAPFWSREFSRYIEPFCGSAALFFRLRPKSAVLSDINTELISFYKTVARHGADVYDIFQALPRTKQTYYRVRQRFNLDTDKVPRAANFFYLNKNCFNGLYRTNRNGQFNVPFSDNRVGRYPTKEEFLAACKILRRARFVAGDFVDIVLSNLNAGDFVYLDPPYASSRRLPFREYYPGSFSVDDIGRLQSLLRAIDQRGAFFVLSYDNNRRVQTLSKQWRKSTYRVHRNISGFSASRRMATEQIITNIEF